jgi:hypothetical protein
MLTPFTLTRIWLADGFGGTLAKAFGFGWVADVGLTAAGEAANKTAVIMLTVGTTTSFVKFIRIK